MNVSEWMISGYDQIDIKMTFGGMGQVAVPSASYASHPPRALHGTRSRDQHLAAAPGTMCLHTWGCRGPS